nr:hypothetical protein [Tanacetum cinerariifolium]
MAGIKEYNAWYVRLLEDVCTGEEHVGDRTKSSMWDGFARRFNGIIEDRLAEEGVLGQKKVDFTGEDCLSYGLTFRRYNQCKSKSGSTGSSSGRSTNRRSTGGLKRQFSSNDVLSFDSQMRRMLVMEILNNLDGLDASYVLKVNRAVRMMIHRADDFTETIKEFKVNMLAFPEWIEMAAIGDTRTGNQWK